MGLPNGPAAISTSEDKLNGSLPWHYLLEIIYFLLYISSVLCDFSFGIPFQMLYFSLCTRYMLLFTRDNEDSETTLLLIQFVMFLELFGVKMFFLFCRRRLNHIPQLHF